MTEPKRPLKVFLCHASTDKPKVRELYRYLKKRGIQPWFDEEDLVGGQDWQVEIPKALATSDAIIICLTKNSVDKEGYIQKEIKFALDKALEMPEGRIFLIPVKFEECEVPFTLSRYQWVDLTIESGYAKMMKALKFRASQLERSTVEVSKKTVEEENRAPEKAAREKEEREATENFAREKAEKEAVEKARLEAEEKIRQKAAKEKAEREANERAERERTEKELREKQVREAREKEKRETEKKEEKPATIRPKTGGQFIYWFGGLIVLVLGIIFLSSLNNPPATPQPTPENTQTQTIATLAQDIVGPSTTETPKSTSTSASTKTSIPLPTEITDVKGVSMVLVPAGEFIMGSDGDAYYLDVDQQPAHKVFLDSFYIDQYEVTNGAYKACVDTGTCIKPYNKSSNNRPSYYGNPEFDNYPVIYVDWYQAKAFCEWREGRLPTEAEWEKSARGTDGRAYPWGDFGPGLEGTTANNAYSTVFTGDTTEVGNFPSGKSIYGAYDMAGNVWEWVSDWYQSDYYATLENNSINPQGPTEGDSKVLRGGAWTPARPIGGAYIDGSITTFNRFKDFPSRYYYDTGFRCAMDAP